MKIKLLLYSDCYIFGGCEMLLVNLINNNELLKAFDVRMAYAKNNEYQDGVNNHLNTFPAKYPLRVLSNATLFYQIDIRISNRYVAFLLKLPFVLLRRSGLYALYNYLKLLIFFRQQQPDILHINNGGYPGAPSCLVAVCSAKTAGVKHIIFSVNNIAHRQKSLLEKTVDRWIHSSVDFFVTASSPARTALIEKRGFSPEKVIQIFNAVRQEDVLNSRNDLLSNFGLAADSFVLVSVAFLTERKGQIYLLNALNELKHTDPELFGRLFLFLVGDGEDRAKIEQYVSEHGLVDKVKITGFRKDYYDFINAADIFILPSIRNEDMPLVILSAMKLGKVIVSTKVGGIVEEIRDRVDGVLLDPSELYKLPLTIAELYADRMLRNRYSESAKQRYRECFALEKSIVQYTALYKQLLST